MSAARRKTTEYLIESVSSEANWTEVTPARDLAGCMTKLSILLLSGQRILAVHQGGERVSDIVLGAMVLLAGRKVMLDRFAASLGVDLLEAERLLGQLFMDEALIMQGLQGLGRD
jgi:hypothetical protein